jgi:flavin reductase (DIM6/NTAB) family NADH-FMN oxidoreductase RutF
MRVPVPLEKAVKLINHGPTTLLTSAARGRVNVMAAAWVMPLDLAPARIAAVIARDTFTRELVEESGELVVNVPAIAMAQLTYRAGRAVGRDVDKAQHLGIALAPASRVGAPLVEGCVAWLECRALDEPGVRESYDLVIADVVAAWADDRVFVGDEWRFEGHPELRTLHHMSKGAFLADGERIAVESE